MKAILLNTYDNQGGAAIATYRLHKGLRNSGVDSLLLVQTKRSDDFTVVGSQTKLEKLLSKVRPYLDALITKLYRHKKRELFSTALVPDSLADRIAKLHPEIIHLFWVAGGFFKVETLSQLQAPIVWTLHDMWPLTGGCHYDDECGKFREACGNCPVLQSKSVKDLSHYVLKRKIVSWDDLPIVVVATSHWLAEMARASAVFKNKRIEVIPNGIDTERYKPIDKAVSRQAWGLPQDKHLILFSAFSATSDPRKGNQFLVPALKAIADEGWRQSTELVIIGASAPQHPVDLGMKVHYIGNLGDEISQVLLYSSVDVTVAPSMQENLSNTVMESLSCGTPVVAFNIGGMPDLIGHKETGYLATPFKVEDLASGIKWILEDKGRHQLLSQAARNSVLEKYALEKVANQYIDLYMDLLK
jgi:glycosyltransferase involved in cell wall biosynthesis